MADSSKREVHLAEFSALRAEIANRTATQNTLATFTLAADGALGSFAFSSGQSRILVLLLLVPLNAATGFLWLDHAHSIYKAGNYIRLRIWAELRQLESSPISTYEEYVLKDRPIWLERSIFLIPFFILFLAPMIGALVGTVARVDVGVLGVFWVLDLLITCYFAASWAISVREFWRPQAGAI
jgi:hypothetical protein